MSRDGCADAGTPTPARTPPAGARGILLRPAPKQTYAKVAGEQVNMISQSWDGKRVYITSLLANWDKGGADNEQFLRGFTWNGMALTPAFEVGFTKEKLGRAHHMRLASRLPTPGSF